LPYIRSIKIKYMKNLITLALVLVTLTSYSQSDWKPSEQQRKEWSKQIYEDISNDNETVLSKFDIDSLELELLTLINNLRRDNNLKPLSIKDNLIVYSDKWCEILMNTKRLKHSNLSDNNIKGENIYGTFSFGTIRLTDDMVKDTPTQIFNGWLSSKLHKSNMLLDNISNVGISIQIDVDENYDITSTMVVN